MGMTERGSGAGAGRPSAWTSRTRSRALSGIDESTASTYTVWM